MNRQYAGTRRKGLPMTAMTSSGIPDPRAEGEKPAGKSLLQGLLILAAKYFLFMSPALLYLFWWMKLCKGYSELRWWLIALSLPAFVYIFWNIHRLDQAGYPKGRTLFLKGRYRRAAPHLVKAWRDNVADAMRMLGDMLLFGLETEQNRDWAVEYYRQAVEELASDTDLLERMPSQTGPNAFLATTKRNMPADIQGWYRGILDNLERTPSGSPEECSLLCTLHNRLGDVDTALAYSRRVPDRKESPNQLESLLILLPDSFDLISDIKDETDDGKPALGVPVRSMSIDRIVVEQILAGVALAVGTVAAVDCFSGPGLGRLLVLFAAVPVGWWLIRRIGRQDRFLVGEKHFLAGRYRTAAKVFSRLSRQKPEPRADKRLGDMHFAGLGVDNDPDRALVAYSRAYYGMNALETFTDPWYRRPGMPAIAFSQGDGVEAWYASMREPLAALGARGHAAAFSLLADIERRMKNRDGEIDNARAAFRVDPDPENEIRLAYALVDAGNGPDRIGEGVEILNRHRRDGMPSAVSALVSYHCGRLVANHKDAGQALERYRELRNAALDAGKGRERALERLFIDSTLLLTNFGPSILTDEDILVVVALEKEYRKGWFGNA